MAVESFLAWLSNQANDSAQELAESRWVIEFFSYLVDHLTGRLYPGHSSPVLVQRRQLGSPSSHLTRWN